MVYIKAAHERVSKEGKPFISLELNGDLELIQSQQTGRFYATVRLCFVSSTLDKELANQFIGQRMPGRIVREECDSYEFKIPATGEMVILGHTWVYQPEERPSAVVEQIKGPYESFKELMNAM